jgi:N-acylmannosamine kinase
MKIIAVDIGGTNIRHAVLDTDGNILARMHNIPTPRDDADALCAAVLSGIDEIGKDFIREDKIVAISSAGLVMPEDGSVIALSPGALPALAERLSLRQIISDATKLPVFILNDGQAATYGEYHAAKKRMPDLENFMFVTVSTGTGGGLVLHGKLITGKNGKAGHIGLTFVNDPQAENLRTIEDISCGRFTGKDDGKLALSARAVAIMIANKTMELDLEAVSLGGGVALGADGYIEEVQKKLLSFCDHYRVPVTRAALGDDAGIVGAALYATAKLPNFTPEKRPHAAPAS